MKGATKPTFSSAPRGVTLGPLTKATDDAPASHSGRLREASKLAALYLPTNRRRKTQTMQDSLMRRGHTPTYSRTERGFFSQHSGTTVYESS